MELTMRAHPTQRFIMAKDLDLGPGVREKYLYENAKRVILAPRNPPR